MDKLYTILHSAHSGLRWVVLILLLAAVVKMHRGWKGKKTFTSGDKKLALFAMISYHTQFLLGLVLYFISPKVQFVEGMMKDAAMRFYAVEHISMMVIAMALITIGYSRSKKRTDDTAKFKALAVFYILGLVIVLASIPWPFREALGGSWF